MISKCIAIVLFLIAFSFSHTFAEESNKQEVMTKVESDGWNYTAWGETIDDAEYLKFTAAIAESIITENPKAIIVYFQDIARRNIDKIKREAGDISEDILWEAIRDGIKDGKITTFDNIRLKAGLATWQRWERVSYHEPRTYKCKQSLPFGGWTWSVCTTTELVEKVVPLPNWHKPYVSIKYR